MWSLLKKIHRLRVQNVFVTNINIRNIRRHYANTSKTDPNKLVVQGPSDVVRFRVRRLRPNDEPKVLGFVLNNSHLVWPELFLDSPAKNKRVLLEDFVCRTLCQGHSLVAEQHEGHRGWAIIRGVALNTSLCPWDAAVLEKWAKCIDCARFKKLMMLSAHCLRAPGLHDKYCVHNILQTVLMVPPNCPKAVHIAQVLARTSVQRGRDMGYRVVRFDVTCDLVNKMLSDHSLVKEWEFRYKIISNPEKSIGRHEKELVEETTDERIEVEKKIVVYTAFPTIQNKSSTEITRNNHHRK